jgi:ribonuclease HI
MVYFARATLRFDGACQPNPGEGGGGYIPTNDNNGKVILEGRRYVGNDCTNNVAEYFGLIAGLKALQSSHHTVGRLDIEGDSELVIRQMKGEYNIRNGRLHKLYNMAIDLVGGSGIDSYSFVHISRDRKPKRICSQGKLLKTNLIGPLITIDSIE